VDLALLFQGLMTAGVLVAGGALVRIAYELSGSRFLIQNVTKHPDKIGSSHTVHPPPHSRAGFAIYVYRNNRWELESDLSAPGYEPSPPTIPGAFEGHVVKKEAWPKRGS
jgi:hypothetical protein